MMKFECVFFVNTCRQPSWILVVYGKTKVGSSGRLVNFESTCADKSPAPIKFTSGMSVYFRFKRARKPINLFIEKADSGLKVRIKKTSRYSKDYSKDFGVQNSGE